MARPKLEDPESDPDDDSTECPDRSHGDKHPPCMSTVSRVANLWAVALTGAVLFVALSAPPVDRFFAAYVPNPTYRLVAKALIIFLILYIVDFYTSNWRKGKNFCLH